MFGLRVLTPWSFTNLAAVTVPDVVGQSQASGTSELEAVNFVVAITTAHSNTVPAGEIISQSPAAGAEAAFGSTVTITVSLGDAPQQESGGGGFFFDFESHSRSRRKRLEELEEIEEEQDRIEDEASREIARLLQIQERKDAERKDLERIKSLVTKYKDVSPIDIDSDRVKTALANAQEKLTRANLERLQKEMERMFDEEDDLLALLFIALNE